MKGPKLCLEDMEGLTDEAMDILRQYLSEDFKPTGYPPIRFCPSCGADDGRLGEAYEVEDEGMLKVMCGECGVEFGVAKLVTVEGVKHA